MFSGASKEKGWDMSPGEGRAGSDGLALPFEGARYSLRQVDRES